MITAIKKAKFSDDMDTAKIQAAMNTALKHMGRPTYELLDLVEEDGLRQYKHILRKSNLEYVPNAGAIPLKNANPEHSNLLTLKDKDWLKEKQLYHYYVSIHEPNIL